MNKKHGGQTIVFRHPPWVSAWAAKVGPKEGEGPYGDTFDRVMPDYYWGNTSWEQAESALLEATVRLELKKNRLPAEKLDLLLAGDLINQIMPSNLAARQLGRPFFGLFGACSTLAEALILASMALDGGFCQYAAAAACSHHYTAGRQYRFPSEQGVQMAPYSQWTVTGAGAALLSAADAAGGAVRLTRATIGKIVDKGQNDPANMGAVMAAAAADTLQAHFADLRVGPEDYDLILTGDLGRVGLSILKALWQESALPPFTAVDDCGAMIFAPEQPEVYSGGSGCGCSAAMLCGPLLSQLQAGKWHRILLVGTGALMSPTTCYQGETIPGIAHAVALEAVPG